MKKASKLKAFMLSLTMTALLLPMTSFAQQTSDDFFRVGDEFNGNRDVVAWTITNNGIGQSETPLGSGLLILGAIGAGYAIAKRKRNKKGAALLLALALTLGFTQCKKKVVEPIANNGNTVHITLTMADGGSKVDVNPTGSGTYATVAFEKDDIIYVGNGNKYVGYVTYNGTDTWEGDLTSPTTDDYLHLYFLGNKAPLSDVTPGTTTEFSVSIADQASKYPVISYNHTLEKYNGEGSYTATTLYNKCSIMKFNVTTPSTAAIYITGMNNKVTVNFANPTVDDNGFSYSVNTTDGGLIKMPAKDASNITWAIVLPQEALAEGAEGSAYTNGYIGNRPAISKIERNHYYAGDGIAITVNTVSKIKDLSTLTENWTAEDGWTLTGTLALNKKISIADDATVTLDGVTINGTNNLSYAWAGITCVGDATIILSGTNTVKGFYEDYPGIQAAHNIGSGDEYTLTIQGTGSLTASSNGYGAGIGGGYCIPCGNIVINGGSSIEATGGNYAAGIGGVGWGCGDITISGGNITANGGVSAAGIGTGNGDACGKITISGGSITANGGERGAGIGTGGDGTCLNITINNTVTSVTATGGAYAAGIGTGYAEEGNNSCGAISINGGTVTATGGLNAAGIGTGYSFSDRTNSCASITIYNTVTSVTATKGSSAPNSIGAGERGTCGTVTIGGVTGAITESPYTYPAPVAPSGAINGLFSVSSTKQVWFSQGNLQYTKSTGVWSFMEHQYSTVETNGSYCTNDYGNRDVVSLFGWATSGYNHGATCYQPYSTNPTNDNYYAYGNASYNLYDQTGQADWGYNAISNGGDTDNSGWRTLTTEEWQYLFANHTKGWSTVNGVNGYVIRPDGVSTAIAASYTASAWETEEAAGAVFLPASGYRNSYVGTDVYDKGSIGRYWSSSIDGSSNAYNLYFSSSLLGPNYSMNRKYGESVRLVKDAD